MQDIFKEIMLKPLSDCVLIRQDDEKLSNTIIIPTTTKLFSGIIVKIGDGKKNPKGFTEPMNVEVGQHVLFGEFSGQKVTLDGQEYLMMRQNDVIGILSDN
jgi:chaperonin GroES